MDIRFAWFCGAVYLLMTRITGIINSFKGLRNSSGVEVSIADRTSYKRQYIYSD
jgi:hypothetical protein